MVWVLFFVCNFFFLLLAGFICGTSLGNGVVRRELGAEGGGGLQGPALYIKLSYFYQAIKLVFLTSFIWIQAYLIRFLAKVVRLLVTFGWGIFKTNFQFLKCLLRSKSTIGFDMHNSNIAHIMFILGKTWTNFCHWKIKTFTFHSSWVPKK